MTTAVTTMLTLNNAVQMPALGLGVFQSTPEETTGAVGSAIASGYRLIDTAAAYLNEREVGEGIRRSAIDRREIFVTTKLWISDYGYDAARRGFDASLRRLGVEYVKLYLLHHPVPHDFDKTLAAYQAAEAMLSEGRTCAIGVANFMPRHLEELIARTQVVPAVNQVEVHPYFSQRDVREANGKHGIVTQSWSPIGGVYSYRPPHKGPLEEPTVVELASRYGKKPAQIVLRWHIEHGLCAIPKSVKPHRIAENIDIFDFELASDDVAAIDALETGVRGGPDPELVDREMFPFQMEND